MDKFNGGNNWTKTIDNGDGTYDSFKWSVGDSANLAVGNVLLNVVIGVIVAFILPTFLMLINLLNMDNKGKRMGNYVAVIFVTAYLFCDYHFGFIIWNGLHKHPELFDILISYNVAIAATALVYMLFENWMYKAIFSEGGSVAMTYFSVMVVMVFLFYKIAILMVPDLIGMKIPVVEIIEYNSWGVRI